MRSWPLINRNKVDDSKVNVPVEALTKSEDEKLRTVAQEVSAENSTRRGALSKPSCSLSISGRV